MQDFQHSYGIALEDAGSGVESAELPAFKAGDKQSLVSAVYLKPTHSFNSSIRPYEQVVEIQLRQEMDVQQPRQKLIGDLVKDRVRAYVDYEQREGKQFTIIRCPYGDDWARNRLVARLGDYVRDHDWKAYEQFMDQVGIPKDDQPSRSFIEYHI